jgi:UMF1 family MFS transporter
MDEIPPPESYPHSEARGAEGRPAPGGSPRPRSRRADRVAFCLYDVGDSAFATTILAVLWNQYFAQQVAGGSAGVRILGRDVPGATLYSWLVALTMLVVAVMGPWLGAWADSAGRRRPWLRGWTFLGVAATIALASVGPGDWRHGSLLFIVAYGSFAAASIFYNAWLPSLGPREELGRISGLAWGLGYLGGAGILVIDLALLASPGRFGLAGTIPAMRVSFALAGVWWLLFALPMLLRPEPAGETAAPAGGRGREALLRAWATLRSFRRTPHFLRYMLAYLLYNDGVQTVVATASIFAAADLGFAPKDLALVFLVIQATGFVGALGWGPLADRWGHKPVLLVQVAGFCAITAWARWIGVFGNARLEFWVLGGVAGIFLGGIQSVSRSLLARWVPEPRAAEIFGFFAVAGRFASVGGPIVFGAMAWAAGGLRPAILSITLFFVAGGALLALVSETRAERELRG